MKTSENINEIAKALALAQSELSVAGKSVLNTFFKNKYSDISDIWNAIREPFTKNGICIVQDVYTTDLGIAVDTRAMHISGQWIECGPFEITVPNKTAQECGKAATYGKRYGLAALSGCVSGEIDDDGESNRQEHLKKEAVSKVSQAEKVTPVMSKGKISKQQGSLLYAMSMKLNAKNKLDMEAILKSNGFKTVYEVTEDRFEWAKEGINKMLNTQPKDSEPEMEEAPF